MENTTKHLALSGRLKAEVRLGHAISAFATVLDSKPRNEFRALQLRRDFLPSGRDVIRLTEEINQEGQRRHRAWRPYGARVGAFLARLQALASLGDVIIGGSQNLIACGVWGVVRFSLEVRLSRLGHLDLNVNKSILDLPC